LSEFRRRPCCRSACHLRRAKDESKPETTSVYKGAGKSLNVNKFFRALDAGYRLVYNEVGQEWPSLR